MNTLINHNQLLNLLISIHMCPVMEWGGQGHSSVSILSWRDSRQRAWLTSSRLSSLLVSRELALSLMLYVPLHIFICLYIYICSSPSFSHLASFSLFHILTYSHYPSVLLSPICTFLLFSCYPFLLSFCFMCSPRLTMSSVMKWWLLMWTVLRLMPTSKKLFKTLP